MAEKPHLKHAGDDMLDWPRIMSNERFRRLPVVEADISNETNRASNGHSELSTFPHWWGIAR